MKPYKFLLSWLGGVIIAILAVSWWRNEGINWAHMGGMILGGVIGVLIAVWIKKAAKTEN